MNKNIEIILCFVLISLAYALKIKTNQMGDLGFERRLPPSNSTRIPSCPAAGYGNHTIPTSIIQPIIRPSPLSPSENTTLPVIPTSALNTSEITPSSVPFDIPRFIPLFTNTTNATLPVIPTSASNTSEITPSSAPFDIPRFIPLSTNTTNATSNLVTSPPPPTGGLIIDEFPLEQHTNLTRETSDQILVPPILLENFPRNEMKIIPFSFWLSANNQTKDFVLLRTRDNMTVSCDLDGLVSLINKTDDDTTQYWIPEVLGENIIRLRSYNGGYLEYDSNNDRFICSNKVHNFKNLLNVFLSSRNGLCLLLKGPDTRFIAHSNDNLMYQNLTMNLEGFCFFGDEKTKLDSVRHYGYPANITDFMGGLPNETTDDVPRSVLVGEEAPLNIRRPRIPLGNTTATVTNITREREMNYTDEILSYHRTAGSSLPPWRRED